MTESSLEDLAAAARRRRLLALAGVFVLSACLAAWLLWQYGFVFLALVVVWVWFLRAPIFEVGGGMELVTTKPPEAVRAEFASPDVPVFALNRGMADSVTDLETGFEHATTGLVHSTRGRIEASVPDGDGPDLTVDVSVNGEQVGVVDVAVEAVGGQTRVVVTPSNLRLDVYAAVLDRLYLPLERRALAARGYVLVEDMDTRVDLRGAFGRSSGSPSRNS